MCTLNVTKILMSATKPILLPAFEYHVMIIISFQSNEPNIHTLASPLGPEAIF